MVNKQLIDYILKQYKVGYSLDTIKNALLMWNYNPAIVDEAIFHVKKILTKQEKTKKSLKLNRFLNILFNPKHTDYNKEIKKTTYYILKIFISFLIIHLIILIIKDYSNRNILVITILTILLLFFILFFVMLFILHLFSYFYYLSLKLVDLPEEYNRIYTIVSYGFTPYIFFLNINRIFNITAPLLTLNLFLLWSFLLISLALFKLGLSIKKSFLIASIPFIFFFILTLIFIPEIIKFI